MAEELGEIIARARQLGASDVHLTAGLAVRMRINGKLESVGDSPLSPAQCEAYAREMAGEDYESMAQIGELDLALSFPGPIRCRANLFRQQGHVSAAIRLLAEKIPRLEDLGLPPAVDTLAGRHNGIVLVTGETGSGKSTTLAALLDKVNHERAAHIITLEDPIEYIYTPDACTISQREVGSDTQSYATGLKAILREDPDVILIGEMRDLETIETALTAAETGHLVFATLHTGSAAETIDRVVDVFPEGRQRQIRMQLSTTLIAVLAQRLIPKRTGGRVVACELMMVTPAIRNLIREGKTPQIASALSTSADAGSITLDNHLLELLRRRVISDETAKAAARDSEYVRRAGRL